MPMEEDLLARLSGAEPVAALVGDRVDWFDRPPALSALTLTKVSPGRDWTMSGPDGLDEPRVQTDAWSATKEGAAALARAVRAEMEQPADVGGTRFHEASVEFERWSTEQVDGVGSVFRIQQDFTFFHEAREAMP